MPKPFAVLQHLVDHPGELVTHDELLATIWPDTYVQPEVLRRYILEIRRALGDEADAPRFVETLPRRGYRFIAPFTDDSRSGSREGVAGLARLVGRDSALADLDRNLMAALSGRRQLVFVVGEAGIGKTSLVDAFRRTCAGMAGTLTVRGQAVEGFGGKEAHYPLLEALGQMVRGPRRTAILEILGTHAPTWLLQFPSLVHPEQRALLERGIAGATRERMVRELCEAVEAITATVAVVLILEDLHWVDEPTLDVISAIARRRERAKLLLVMTLRPAEMIVSESPLKALKHDLLLHGLSDEVELERLQESDVAAYLAGECATGDLPVMASIIHRHSDGNPLFMVAMLDHLAKTGVLARANAGWSVTRPLDQFDPGVPDTLKQMLEMQLEHASPAERQLLKAASVAGQHFTEWAVRTMLPDSPSNVEDACNALVDRQQFLKYSGTRELTDEISTETYRFAHALYREVLYRRLSPTQRTTFHRRLAIGLDQLRTPVEPELAGEVALHFEEGHEYEPAIRYLILSAQNATRRYAHQQAIAVLQHAQGLVARLPVDQAHALDLQILERIGSAYYALGDMDRSAAMYESMAVRAANAGLLAEQAEALMRLAHLAEAAPFFKKAIELDPNLVSAYTSLSRIYSNLGELERAKEYARLAYEHRERAGPRESLAITYQYHFEVTGDQRRAGETLEAWKQSFPLEFQPANSLTLMHNFLGDFERATEEGQEAVRRNPSHGYPYSNLAHAYRGIGQFADARQVAEQAAALQIETLPTRRLLYQLALIDEDERTAAKHLEWARDQPREFDMIGAHAQALAWSGQVRAARQLYEEAARLAELRNLPDVGNSHLAWAISMELAYGNDGAAIELARRVLTRNPSYDPRLRAAVALAAAGFDVEAEATCTELAGASPDHTFINLVLVPIVRAAVEIARARPVRAIEQLRIVAPYELGFIAALAPIHLRGQAYLMMGSAPQAAEQFERILNHRGSDPFSPFHAVAPLGLARARALGRDHHGSFEAYERFLANWKDADRDIPVLAAAQQECGRLARDAKR